MFAPFFFDNRIVRTSVKLGITQIQGIIVLFITVIALMLLISLFLLLSGTNSENLWRSKRDSFLLSLREEIEEYALIQDTDPDIAVLFEENLQRTVRLGSELLGGELFVIDSAQDTVAHTNPEMIGLAASGWTDLDYITSDFQVVTEAGWLVGYLGEPLYMNGSKRILWIMYLVILILIITVVPLILYFIHRTVIVPLREFSERARIFSRGTPVVIRNEYFIREIDNLAYSLNDMMDAVMNREESLRRLNESLEENVVERTKAHKDTIETLRTARNHLLLSEKMSVPGSLVSGVAHEINTPLGIGVTSASFLSERSVVIYREWDNRSLSQEDLEHFFKDTDEASRIIQKNLEHAAKILNSLKQVAVDQQREERREFELVSYLEDIILSLKHQLKPGRHRIELQSHDVLMVNLCPCIITQILNNLVFNSVTHGFDGNSGGRILLGCRSEGDEVVLVYEDDGRGLSEEETEHIFDQFFTTRRDSGGTGLGMNIVYNLVSEKRKGEIQVKIPESGGAGFTLRFPKNPRGQ